MPDGTVDQEKAVDYLMEMPTLLGQQRKKLVDLGKAKPTASSEVVLEEAKKPPKVYPLKVDIPFGLYERLKNASEALDKDEGDVVELALTDYLARLGV